MNAAKIRLSQKEMELVINADWILTKNHILQKVNELLGGIHTLQESYIRSNPRQLLPEAAATGARISKGENYKGLPYLILDHPRLFQKEDVFAIRTMFWWGNFFSITLHLSGQYKIKAAANIMAAYSLLAADGYSLGIHTGQWEHHFEKDNYKLVTEMSNDEFTARINASPFIKLAKKIPLEKWDEAAELLTEYFSVLVKVTAG
jgi:hypothetical protein